MEILVGQEGEGMRLDAFMAQELADLSRSRIKDLILEGAVSLGGATIGEPRHKVKSGDCITLEAPPTRDATPKPEAIALDILYEDDQLIVINKPAGLVVHPAPGNETGTLVNALIHHCGDSLQGIGGERRPGIVHRLDKDTSGVMVAAKTEVAHNALAKQFADHGRTGPLERAYTAWVWGGIDTPRGTIDAPIGRDGKNRLKQAVRQDGRQAITHYTTERRFAGENFTITRLTCRLETGRTHQIRVHMAHITHPLIADPLYSRGYATKIETLPEHAADAIRKLNRQALHAHLLGFAHPVSGETMEFTSPLPADLLALDAALEAVSEPKARPAR